jgi:hypothetical protein
VGEGAGKLLTSLHERLRHESTGKISHAHLQGRHDVGPSPGFQRVHPGDALLHCLRSCLSLCCVSTNTNKLHCCRKMLMARLGSACVVRTPVHKILADWDSHDRRMV